MNVLSINLIQEITKSISRVGNKLQIIRQYLSANPFRAQEIIKNKLHLCVPKPAGKSLKDVELLEFATNFSGEL